MGKYLVCILIIFMNACNQYQSQYQPNAKDISKDTVKFQCIDNMSFIISNGTVIQIKDSVGQYKTCNPDDTLWEDVQWNKATKKWETVQENKATKKNRYTRKAIALKDASKPLAGMKF